MKLFKKIYLWSLNTKLYMGIYFVTVVVILSAMTLWQQQTTLEIMTLIEGLILSIIIAFLQTAILREWVDYGRGIYFIRSVSWLLLSVFFTLIISVWGDWFSSTIGMMGYFILATVMFFALTCVLIGLKWGQDLDTKRLNVALEAYKNKK